MRLHEITRDYTRLPAGPRRVRVRRRRQEVPLQALQGPHPLDAACRRRALLQEGVQDGARAAQKAALGGGASDGVPILGGALRCFRGGRSMRGPVTLEADR